MEEKGKRSNKTEKTSAVKNTKVSVSEDHSSGKMRANEINDQPDVQVVNKPVRAKPPAVQSIANEDEKKGICKLFKQGKCFYGDKCKFQHGKVKVALNQLCKMFVNTGKCKFETKCHFVHMAKEEWEEKYRRRQPEQTRNEPVDVSSDDSSDDENKESFEFKSKVALKKEKQKRLEQEHKQHKEHIADTKAKKIFEQEDKKDQIEKESVEANESTKLLNEVKEPVDDHNETEVHWFDLDMIHLMGNGKVPESKRKIKPWFDQSKTDEGKALTISNNKNLFNNDYVGYMKGLQTAFDKDLAQTQRSYMSSFVWEEGSSSSRAFKIHHTPSCRKELLPINFDIKEGYLIIRVVIDANSNIDFQLANTSIPREIRSSIEELMGNVWRSQGKSIYKMMKYVDSNLERIFKSSHDLIEKKKKEEIDNKARKEREEEEALLEEIRAMEEALFISKPVKLNEKKVLEDDDSEEDEDEEEGFDDEEDDNYDPYYNVNAESGSDEEEEVQVANTEKLSVEDLIIELDLNMHCYLKDLRISKIAHIRVNSLLLQVQCKSCKYVTELTLMNLIADCNQQILVNNLVCVSCNRIAAIHALRSFVFESKIEDSQLAFRIGSFTWNLLDIQSAGFEVVCEQCEEVANVAKYVSGQNYSASCHKCFQALSFSYFGFKIEKKLDQEYLARMREKKAKVKVTVSSVSMRPKKIGSFKLGQPLPKNGACSHYKNSYRYFRFPCCGKPFPCDICHDEVERGHDKLLAKSIICGFCSKEQSIKQECSGCKKLLVKIASKNGFWEGGRGTRNHALMSKTDPHKFSGLSKTVSRRKAAKDNAKKK